MWRTASPTPGPRSTRITALLGDSGRWRCVENAFRIVPPGSVQIPSKTRLYDAQINIQAAIGNTYGCVDNLAWLWMHERDLTHSIDRKQVGLRKHHKKVRETLSVELRAYLDTLEDWFVYLVEYRDAFTHRIPLYIPPGGVRPFLTVEKLGLKMLAELAAMKGVERIRHGASDL
jgi:hypothetical protein